MVKCVTVKLLISVRPRILTNGIIVGNVQISGFDRLILILSELYKNTN